MVAADGEKGGWVGVKPAEGEKWAMEIARRLGKEYPDARIMLKYSNPFELLVATILSAQSTDKKTNEITADLFKKYRKIEDYAAASPAEMEKDIYSSGFFRNKAKSVIGSARKILSDFGGKVPLTMEELLTLPGVARKTANIVLYNAFGVVEGMAVDTHVRRLAGRLGLSGKTNPDKIERDLTALLPRRLWGPFCYLLIEHGRKVCAAKKADCAACVLNRRCPSAFRLGCRLRLPGSVSCPAVFPRPRSASSPGRVGRASRAGSRPA